MPAGRASLVVLVLAAGQGKRLRSKTIKLLHPVAGRPMVEHVLDAARALRPSRLITVIGHQAELVRERLGDGGGEFVLQKRQLGTGHAVLTAAKQIGRAPRSALLVLNGDVPTLRPATLRRLVTAHRRRRAALSFLTAEVADPRGYGRIVRDESGDVLRIVEQRDSGPRERRIREINCGIYCADPALLLRTLRSLRPDNTQKEYYLTDAVHALLERGERVQALIHDDAHELLGVNTRHELAQAARTLYARKAEELQTRGVTLLDAERTRIDPRARVGSDSVIHPDVIIEGPTTVGRESVVQHGCRIVDCRLGNGVEIKDHSLLIDARVGDGAQVGPFAHLRPGSVLAADSRVGNFVELKKATLGRGSKASHLTYLGDVTVGPDSNIGAGTITCNYDGRDKHPTTIGRGVFVGSGTQLVAPVRLLDGAYVAAGSTVTEDVPGGALALSRCRQRNVLDWVARRKKAKQARKTGRRR